MSINSHHFGFRLLAFCILLIGMTGTALGATLERLDSPAGSVMLNDDGTWEIYGLDKRCGYPVPRTNGLFCLSHRFDVVDLEQTDPLFLVSTDEGQSVSILVDALDAIGAENLAAEAKAELAALTEGQDVFSRASFDNGTLHWDYVTYELNEVRAARENAQYQVFAYLGHGDDLIMVVISFKDEQAAEGHKIDIVDFLYSFSFG